MEGVIRALLSLTPSALVALCVASHGGSVLDALTGAAVLWALMPWPPSP